MPLIRPKSAFLPRSFSWWPEGAVDLVPEKIEQTYKDGYAGVWHDPAATEVFESFIVAQPFGDLDGRRVSDANSLTGAGEGKLVIPYRLVEQLFPGCWPGAAQQRGDCVAHSTKNATLLTMACDIASGKPDEVTGKIEGAPIIDPDGIKNGALSTEAIYWYRGYSGDGWSCDAAAQIACSKSGLWLRNNYPELNVDLRKYSGKLAGQYGRTAPPPEFTKAGQEHLIRTATRLRSLREWCDYLANGFGLTTCGGEGFSNQRDENGVSRRSGSWSHALAVIGVDERDIIVAKYGEPLVLILNSWGKWNTGSRRIMGTNIDIPEGAFWARWSNVKNRLCLALSGAAGWPAKKLPEFSLLVG